MGEDLEVELCRDLEIRRLLPLLAGCGIRRLRGRFACVRIPLRADQVVKLQAALWRRVRIQGRQQLQRMERSAGQLSFPFVWQMRLCPMRRQPKALTRPGGDPVAICGACRREVPLYRGRLSIHGSRLGQGLCPGAGEEAREGAKASRAADEPEAVPRPMVGPEQYERLKTLKRLLQLSGCPDVRIFVAPEGLELHLFRYAALEGLLPHLVRYEGQLLSSSFSQVRVLIPASKVKRLCGFLMRQSKRAGRSAKGVDERQLRLFEDKEVSDGLRQRR